MKRTHGNDDPVDPLLMDEEGGTDDTDDAEMDVDDEEKADRDEDGEEGKEETIMEQPGASSFPEKRENPFLDSFYGISSADAAERAHAAQVLLHHSLLGGVANAKDAAYALRRLMNGLCSGRAAARQGNAAALASFLKVAFALGKMGEIRSAMEQQQQSSSTDGAGAGSSTMEEEKGLSDLAYVRHRLRASTEPGESQGRRKGSEERDYQFGRLFGINGIVRSGILLPGVVSGVDLDDIQTVTKNLLSDLAELYGYKKWIREPAAHAICTLLNTLYAACPVNADAQTVVEHVVESVVVPQLLMKGDNDRDGETSSLFAAYSAEQIAIAVNIQSWAHLHTAALPVPINKPILTKETVPVLASALSETSVVTQPRTHLFWDTLWSFAFETETGKSAKVDSRRARRECPMSKESVDDLLGAVLQHVIMERLLGVSSSEEEQVKGSSGKATHERRALALCLVRNLSGVEFVSSISGRTRLIVGPEMLEHLVFCPTLVQRLFLDIICAGQQKKQSAHLLKPLALKVLDLVSESVTEVDVRESEESLNRRLAVAKALLQCEPRFDSRTKTSTIESLLRLSQEASTDEVPTALWTQYMSYLEHQIVTADPTLSGSDTDKSRFKAVGYIDLLFQLGKRLSKIAADDESSFAEFKASAITRILGFFMSIAFFDCSGVVAEAGGAPKKKKKKQRQSAANHSPAIQSALVVRDSQKEGASTLPFEMRSVASARFFSLLSDLVALKVHSSNPDRESSILEYISGLHEMKAQLVMVGAKQLAVADADDQMDTDDEEDPEAIVAQLRKDAQRCQSSDSDESRKRMRWASGCALLASTLHLHLLSCGRPESGLEDDDPDADEEEDVEEITSIIADVHHVAKLYSSDKASEDNPLSVLAELCVNILSSPLGIGNQSRGASPTLFREVVKIAWTSGLNLSATEPQKYPLDTSLVNILLNAIGAVGADNMGDEEDVEEEEEDDEDDRSESDTGDSDGGSEDGVFAQATGVAEVRDVEMSEGSRDEDKIHSTGEEETELELDSSKLQALLEEGSDADVDEGELEHHEGADAALAKLIQLKQEARKAGQVARERAEIARQIRCIVLVETLVVGKAETWGPLLRVDLILQMIVPILQYRRELAKHLSKTTQKGSTAGLGEKRALLDRLTALLKAKILKAKVPDWLWSDSVDSAEYADEFANKLINLAKDTVDKEHQSLCNSGLLFMLRATTDTDAKLERAALYADAVAEWSTKRTTRLEVTFFEGFIHQNPVLAQACLSTALASAASAARSSFLKSESFRLLCLLYNTKLNSNETELDKIALERMFGAANQVLLSVAASLKDKEMQKTKRIREVLKTTEKVFAFLSTSTRTSSLDSERLDEITELLEKLQADSDSQGIQNSCEKLLKEIAEFKQRVSADPKEEVETKVKSSGGKKKKQKSKKKKSKR